MPKIYEYLGIILFFYSNEHEPIHIHGKFQGKESKAEIHLKNGRITKIVVKDKGAGLESKKKREFEEFVNCYADDIVEKWIDYFVKKKHVSPTTITKKVKNVRTISG
ncbi:DUF4160 domain-containing protein [Vibrio parahaemolyticus]|nr:MULTISPECIES: DUF4160 domain-containing protein [Vibrio]AGQ92249.1 hypothetical protein M634_10860 [Vibrio parahaemolyticus O1:Kuk str. FDA_R31]AVW99006.1 hypothetical protein BJD94_03320 [Vibrio vulnificus Env1]EGQ7777239.1 DUF4160 domain-containing protein [Vibrio parahaemolyticus]EGQ7835453.1 DUF4160 domain-containing protein [Vibrio vulnificus]EGQ7854852.1 DUF4160 domain-containing protein [Vibrio vulnificus]